MSSGTRLRQNARFELLVVLGLRKEDPQGATDAVCWEARGKAECGREADIYCFVRTVHDGVFLQFVKAVYVETVSCGISVSRSTFTIKYTSRHRRKH